LSHDFSEINRVCIYGTGGVGGYFGGRIAEALQKHEPPAREIYFIARGEHLKALQKDGITVKTPERTIRSVPTGATSNYSEIPAPDLILLCVKSYDLQAATADIKTTAKVRLLRRLNPSKPRHRSHLIMTVRSR
jgi:2-dehydropantoate 2-reductase